MKQTKSRDRVRSKHSRSRFWIAAMAALSLLAIFGLGPALHSVRYADATPSFAIVSPETGTTVGSPVQLSVAVKGAGLGWPITGRDHLHVAIDGGSVEAVYEDRLLSLPLVPGRHTVVVELAGPSHAALLPPKYVTFTVR